MTLIKVIPKINDMKNSVKHTYLHVRTLGRKSHLKHIKLQEHNGKLKINK